jgi:hypothetical protein
LKSRKHQKTKNEKFWEVKSTSLHRSSFKKFYFVIYVGKVFFTKSHLARYISTHISKEPYVGILYCDLCWMSFPQKSHLARYICSHISKEPYVGILFWFMLEEFSTKTTSWQIHK